MSIADKFVDMFGNKPLIAGVYPIGENPVGRMIDEVKMLADEGVSGAYLENVNGSWNDLKMMDKSLDKIAMMDLPIRVGVNVLPDGNGTEHVEAFRLSEKYNLSFIVLDAISGTHKIGDETFELDSVSYIDGLRRNPDVVVFGGLNPPYAELIDTEKFEYLLRSVGARSDAIMIKSRPEEASIPIKKVEFYRKKNKVRKIILASKLKTRNIRIYAPLADGFMVGSGLRVGNNPEGLLSCESIRAMSKVLEQYR